MATTDRHRIMSKGDTAAMWFFMVLGGAFAVITAVRSVIRIIEVLTTEQVQVFAEFAGTPADAPIGPAGTPVEVELDTAWISSELPAASTAAIVIEQVIIAVGVAIVVGSLLVIVWNVLRGRVFSRTNTRLAITAGTVGLATFMLAPFFANMGANGAFARISDQTFNNVVASADLVPILAVAFIAALGATVFSVGERLQRDTEGLV